MEFMEGREQLREQVAKGKGNAEATLKFYAQAHIGFRRKWVETWIELAGLTNVSLNVKTVDKGWFSTLYHLTADGKVNDLLSFTDALVMTAKENGVEL